jgi:hypothetical protein
MKSLLRNISPWKTPERIASKCKLFFRGYIARGISSLWLCAAAANAQTDAELSATASLNHLRAVMDEFHNRFPVYDDVSSPGNHFHAFGKIPGANAPVAINGSYTINPHSGATAIRCELLASGPGGPFGGYYFQNGTLSGKQRRPQVNFGILPNAGTNLTGATKLTFWARGENGGEIVDFFMGGIGWPLGTTPFPDSTDAVKIRVTLSNQWAKYTINLQGKNLSYIQGGFGWVASRAGATGANPSGAVFYLDDIQYELGPDRLERRLNEPRFLRSFTTLPLQPDPFDDTKDGDIDFVLRNAAFTYDNALAILAFLAERTDDGLRRAKLIGTAFVRAQTHDRTPAFSDGRLRSVYAAGDIALPQGWTPKGRAKTVPIPGYYDEDSMTFYEVEQRALDTGNNAWAMIALLALHRETGDIRFLRGARRIGIFVERFRDNDEEHTFRGFQGGIIDPEIPATKALRVYASSEHNLDLFAAYTVLNQIAPKPRWSNNAQHAQTFVEQMWDTQAKLFRAGTADPATRNMVADQVPLDVQAWSILSLPGELSIHPEIFVSAEANHRTTDAGFSGFDFNNDKDGVWFEGTAQMAVAYSVAGFTSEADALRATLRQAQSTPPFGDGEGIAASSRDGLTTGFESAPMEPFKYFRRLHIGATAWNVFAQLGVNPYYLVPD